MTVRRVYWRKGVARGTERRSRWKATEEVRSGIGIDLEIRVLGDWGWCYRGRREREEMEMEMVLSGKKKLSRERRGKYRNSNIVFYLYKSFIRMFN